MFGVRGQDLPDMVKIQGSAYFHEQNNVFRSPYGLNLVLYDLEILIGQSIQPARYCFACGRIAFTAVSQGCSPVSCS